MIRCQITSRLVAGGVEPLITAIEKNLKDGVEWIQIREKDLSGRDLAALVRRVVSLAAPCNTRILVNTRADIALACGAHGLHLPAASPPPFAFRSIVPPGFRIGVSCHTLDEVAAAEREGADYVLYGPVFSPLSKTASGAPVGLEGLKSAASAVRIPVLALGGITWQNARDCVAAGAAGVAGITLFLP